MRYFGVYIADYDSWGSAGLLYSPAEMTIEQFEILADKVKEQEWDKILRDDSIEYANTDELAEAIVGALVRDCGFVRIATEDYSISGSAYRKRIDSDRPFIIEVVTGGKESRILKL